LSVLVSGMHRSGTSMLGQWVSTLGIVPGDGALYEANPANPRGLYERHDVVDFNDRWLGVLGGSWWAPPNVKEQTWRSIDPKELERDRQSLDVFHPDNSGWFVKDPRLSLLLPLWDRLALQRLPVLIGVREPRDVAMSLNVRNGMTLRRGLALWVAYNHEIFCHLAGRRSLVVDLSTGFEDATSAVKAVAVFLAGQELPVHEHEIQRTGAGVESYLRRHRCEELEGSSELLAKDLDDIYRAVADRHLVEAEGASIDFPVPDWAREALDELSEFWDMKIKREILDGDLARLIEAYGLLQADLRTAEGARLVAEAELNKGAARRAVRAVVPKKVRDWVRGT